MFQVRTTAHSIVENGGHGEGQKWNIKALLNHATSPCIMPKCQVTKFQKILNGNTIKFPLKADTTMKKKSNVHYNNLVRQERGKSISKMMHIICTIKNISWGKKRTRRFVLSAGFPVNLDHTYKTMPQPLTFQGGHQLRIAHTSRRQECVTATTARKEVESHLCRQTLEDCLFFLGWTAKGKKTSS